jgi:nitrogen fixation/metabolism regulation signal transduction histidine kinase
VAALQTLRASGRDDIDDERASKLAHDINNPLTYVTANLELLARRLDGSAGNWVNWQEMRELVAESREGVERIRRVVRAFQPPLRRHPGSAHERPVAG